MDDRYVAGGLISRCEHCAVRNGAVCGALKPDEIEHLNRIVRRRTVKPGETILSDEEPADFLANIVSGVIKLTKTLSDGRQQIVGLQFAPDFLGRAYGASHRYFAEAATEVELCCFPRAEFEKLLVIYPDLEHRLFERTLRELDAAREWMVLLGRKTAEVDRLAAAPRGDDGERPATAAGGEARALGADDRVEHAAGAEGDLGRAGRHAALSD